MALALFYRHLDDGDLILGQPVKLVDEPVDLLIDGFNLVLEEGPLVAGTSLEALGRITEANSAYDKAQKFRWTMPGT